MTVSLWQRALGYASLMGVVQALLCLLVVRQMERGGPGSAGKIAYTTVAVQAAMDSYFFVRPPSSPFFPYFAASPC